MNTKLCSACKENLDYNKFGKNKTKTDGFQSICKECRCKYQKNHYKNNSNYYKINAKKTKGNYISCYR